MNYKVSDFLIWLSVLVAMGLIMAFSFYLFIFLLPIILLGIVGYMCFYLYCYYVAKHSKRGCGIKKSEKSEKIIDVEYEVLDNKK